MEPLNTDANQADDNINKDSGYPGFDDNLEEDNCFDEKVDGDVFRNLNPSYSSRRKLEEYLDNKYLENLLNDIDDYYWGVDDN